MANICTTEYIVEGELQELQDLYAKMHSLVDSSSKENSAAQQYVWLGRLISSLGGEPTDYYCPGEWCDLELDEQRGVLTFTVDSKWVELDQVRNFICERYPSLIFYYRAEEFAGGVFETNDVGGRYFASHRVVLQDEEGEWTVHDFRTAKEACRFVSDFCNREIDSVDKLKAEFGLYNVDASSRIYYIHYTQAD
ncbi:MAG: hypothetical protein IJX65_06965 [Alistipes sp.]|nr:hypothetical protein [Alistipes sp.]